MSTRRWRKILGWTAALGLTGLALGAGGIAGVFWYYGRDIEHVDVAAIRDYRPPQVTRIVARDGTVLGEIFSQRRTLIRFEDVPKHVVDAFLAAEDADFYNHEGMDYFGMVRAALSNIEAGELRQGASTITQQVVKNFLLSQDRTFERKIQELLLARRLEQALSKHEILELYLNDIFLGHGRYGIEEASRFYFGKSVREIDLGQAAILAALPKAPGRSTPIKEPEKVKARQVYVLQQMVANGFAQPQEVEAAIADPMALGVAKEGDAGTARTRRSSSTRRASSCSRSTARRSSIGWRNGDHDRGSAGAGAGPLRAVRGAGRARQAAGLRPQDQGGQAQGAGEGAREGQGAAGGRWGGAGGDPGARRRRRRADAFVAKAGDSDILVRVPEGTRYDDVKLTHDGAVPGRRGDDGDDQRAGGHARGRRRGGAEGLGGGDHRLGAAGGGGGGRGEHGRDRGDDRRRSLSSREFNRVLRRSASRARRSSRSSTGPRWRPRSTRRRRWSATRRRSTRSGSRPTSRRTSIAVTSVCASRSRTR
jgi:penicillin-binding protein 1A